MQALGIHVRAGLHTGECEIRGDDIGGVSSPLRDLVIGSGLEFEERGPG